MTPPNQQLLHNQLLHLQSTPRSIRFCARSLWFIRLFILPHTLIGIGMLLWFPTCILWLIAGHNLPATITRAWDTYSRKHGTVYHIDYRYTTATGDHTDNATIDSTTYQRIRPLLQNTGQIERDPNLTRRVRVLSLGKWHYAFLVDSTWSYLSPVLFSLFIAVFWNGIVSVFLYFAWIVPYRHRALAMHGTATLGEVQKVTTGKGASAHYTFRTLTGQPISGRTTLLKPSTVKKGPAIILYNPDHPTRNVLLNQAAYQPLPVA